MGCEKGARPIKQKVTESNENLNQPQKEEKTMSSTMVRQMMPEFTMDAYDAKEIFLEGSSAFIYNAYCKRNVLKKPSKIYSLKKLSTKTATNC